MSAWGPGALQVMVTIEELADRAFDDSPTNPLAVTQALAVMRDGEIVFERYAEGFDASSTFWAKTFFAATPNITSEAARKR